MHSLRHLGGKSHLSGHRFPPGKPERTPRSLPTLTRGLSQKAPCVGPVRTGAQHMSPSLLSGAPPKHTGGESPAERPSSVTSRQRPPNRLDLSLDLKMCVCHVHCRQGTGEGQRGGLVPHPDPRGAQSTEHCLSRVFPTEWGCLSTHVRTLPGEAVTKQTPVSPISGGN